ncbi:MAG TPA: NIPSNAP family protein [Pyrinomonadaceae bacterium]|nr:NIPSNAP family protein [Pyrinomonadaceae bacterium]
MKANPKLKVIELRNYLLKPGMRQRFTDYFEDHFIESQEVLGGYVFGQFRIQGDDDKFFWIRGFEDMQSRLDFLRRFYERGEVWKEFGPGANELMLDSDNVYLLRPLRESFNVDELPRQKGIIVIEFYFANPNQLEQLTGFFRANYASFLKSKPTLWVSEITANDFPRLPVIQDQNLLVSITPYAGESEFQTQLRQSAASKDRMRRLIANESSLILYPTAKSLNRDLQRVR